MKTSFQLNIILIVYKYQAIIHAMWMNNKISDFQVFIVERYTTLLISLWLNWRLHKIIVNYRNFEKKIHHNYQKNMIIMIIVNWISRSKVTINVKGRIIKDGLISQNENLLFQSFNVATKEAEMKMTIDR